MPAKILVVDDDKNICKLIEIYLQKEDYQVITAMDGQEAIDKYYEYNPQLVVLDIMLPQVDGWEVCQEIREDSNVPILMLTAKGEKDDKLKGLEIGADDYVTKPFDPDELVARVKVILRRTKISQEEEVLTFPNLRVDHQKRQVNLKGQTLDLAPKEYDLLYFLVRNEKQVFSREQLLDKVWGFDFIGDIRTVDTHIKRLRNKIESQVKDYNYFHTVWGVGYKFEVTEV
ncbi:response regulator with CheY-like receiver domain and winged-helix DNA-binding domain [Halobacteroides halobius DSM 5150]|uniref:Stage 0 sporulation protein A homolog n=1 Tax=Halobacteroides halobius (strain ATCC 35273 / DSM 5150 / MD-1) TaxID=748449 RepID=L0KAA0_HALHC|nr:response regulator transcription factor [Halobacteroides halobius]AGB41465.1 response regulator with CheY-like receiver domain and winged-helix DNA-binding domain [Halobacteroides halobius DSM 5150]